MDNGLKWLVMAQLIIISIVVIIKLIFMYLEHHKVNRILKFFDKRINKNKDIEDKYLECLKLIEQNRKD